MMIAAIANKSTDETGRWMAVHYPGRKLVGIGCRAYRDNGTIHGPSLTFGTYAAAAAAARQVTVFLAPGHCRPLI